MLTARLRRCSVLQWQDPEDAGSAAPFNDF
jgi:hypothetical protein